MKRFAYINPYRVFLLIFCSALTLCVTHVYLHPGFPYTHDGENHLARFANYTLALREHQFPPRFAPNLFSHYGYPVFDFNYPLANILSVPFSYLHFNYELTFKILAIGAVFAGLVGTYLWLSALHFQRPAKLFALGLFAVCPYLINTIVVRGDIGEIFALCLLPWVFWAIEQRSFLPSICIFTAFLLAHNTTAVFAIPILFVYVLLRCGKNTNAWKKVIVSGCVATLLTLWFWIPAVFEKSATILDSSKVNTEFTDFFPTISQLFWAPIRFGFAYKGTISSLSFTLGEAQLFILIVASLVVLKLRSVTKTPPIIFFCGALCLELIILQLNVSKPFWMLVAPIAKYLQFPWRLALFWQILILPIAAFVFTHVTKRWRVVLILVLCWQAYGFWSVQPADYFHRDIRDYDNFSQSTSTNNENLPKTFTYQPSADWEPTPQIVQGTGQVHVMTWRGSSRQYQLQLTTPATIVEPTMNFLGWETRIVSDPKQPLIPYVNSPEIGGRIAYQLPAGTYILLSAFTQHTWPREFGNWSSLVTVVFLLAWCSWRGVQHIRQNVHI